jgi:hypothetical protein
MLVALVASLLLASSSTEASEAKVQDRIGVTVGRIKEAPDGHLLLQDRIGVTQGHVRQLPDGRVVVQDRVGVRTGSTSRNAFEDLKRRSK